MISDEVLRGAAIEAGEVLMRCIPPEDECFHEYSKYYKNRTVRLYRRANHPYLYRTLNRVASVFLALLLTSTVWLSVDVHARELFFGWIREAYETFFAYRYVGEKSSKAERNNYRLTEIPDNWVELDSWTDESGGTTLYSDGTNGLYHFTYTWANSGMAAVVETREPIMTHVHKSPAEFYEKNASHENSLLIWEDEETRTFFALSATLSQEKMIEIAESLIVIE